MLRKLLLISVISLSIVAFGQKGGGTAGGGAQGSGGNAGTSGAAGQPTIPTTQGATGGLSGQQAQAPGMNNPSQTDVGAPTIPQTMGGPAGNSGNTQANPANLNNPNGLNGGGFVTGGTTGGGVILSTPTASFDSPQPTAGISNAGRAGISNSTPLNTGLQNTLNPSTVVYSNYSEILAGGISPAIAAVNAANEAGSSEIGPANDLGLSYYNDSIWALVVNSRSLAEVAAFYKTQANAQHRTYTNADVPRENAGRLGNSVLAANTPPPLPQGSTAQGSTAAPSQATQQPAQNAQPQETQSQTAGTATTPQINQPKSTNENEAGSLPATSTLLPLLGLLGIASGGIGMWYRRHRK